MPQRAMGQNRAPGHCNKDKAFVHGVSALPGELLGAPTRCYFEPKYSPLFIKATKIIIIYIGALVKCSLLIS